MEEAHPYDIRLTESDVRRAETLRMESVSTRLGNETYRYVRETADERDVSVAEVLRELVEQGIDYDDLKTETETLRDEVRRLRDARLGAETERLVRETLADVGDDEEADGLPIDAVVRRLVDQATDADELARANASIANVVSCLKRARKIKSLSATPRPSAISISVANSAVMPPCGGERSGGCSDVPLMLDPLQAVSRPSLALDALS